MKIILFYVSAEIPAMAFGQSTVPIETQQRLQVSSSYQSFRNACGIKGQATDRTTYSGQ